MRIRTVAVGACACLALAACSSSSSNPPTTGGTTPAGGSHSVSSSPTMTMSHSSSGGADAAAFCQQFKVASKKLQGLTKNVSSPTQLGKAIGPIVTELQQLQSDAPSQVTPELHDLVTAMQSAAQATSGGDIQKIAQQMQKLEPKLAKDFQSLETYVMTNCH